MVKKKIWAKFQRIVEVFTQTIFNMLSNIWVGDPGSGKNLIRIPDLGVKKAPIPDPGSGSATLFKSMIKLTKKANQVWYFILSSVMFPMYFVTCAQQWYLDPNLR